MKSFTFHFYISLLLIFTPQVGLTESNDLFYDYEEEIVVTGTRTGKVISDAPVKTEVIPEEQIEEYHYKSADEVLPHLPGVITQTNTLSPGGQFATIQGLGDDHVLVLIDGIPQSQNSSFGFDLSRISAAGIQKIEVVKGASSALYGSQAMGGVINVITKKPSDKVSYDFDIESGRYPGNEIQNENDIPGDLAASISQKISRFGYRFYAGARNRAAVNRDLNFISQDQSKITKLDGGVRLSYDGADEDKYSLNYRIFSEEIEGINGTPSPVLGVVASRTRTDLKNQNLSLTTENHFGDNHKVTFNAFYETVNDDRTLADSLATPFVDDLKKSQQTDQRGEVQWDFSAFDRHFFTVGTVWRRSSLNQENFIAADNTTTTSNIEIDSKSYESIQLFVQDDIIYNKWEWVPGVRIQSDESFGVNVSPKMTVSYNTKAIGKKTIFRSSVGTGYRVPSLKERFYFLDHRSIGNYIVSGNENLQPEESISYQLGSEIILSKKSSLYFNLFVNRVDNLINTTSTQTDSSLLLFQYQNIDSVDIHGAEMNARGELLSWLRGETSITYTNAEDRSTGNKVPLRPNISSRSSLNFGRPSQDFSVSSILTVTGRQFTDLDNNSETKPFSTFDLRFNYKANKTSTFYFGVENLFDEKRPPSTDDSTFNNDLRPNVGQYLYLGFKVRG